MRRRACGHRPVPSHVSAEGPPGPAQAQPKGPLGLNQTIGSGTGRQRRQSHWPIITSITRLIFPNRPRPARHCLNTSSAEHFCHDSIRFIQWEALQVNHRGALRRRTTTHFGYIMGDSVENKIVLLEMGQGLAFGDSFRCLVGELAVAAAASTTRL